MSDSNLRSDTTSRTWTPEGEPTPVAKGSHVYLIDGSGYIFRAFFAMFKAAQSSGRNFTRSDGTPTGAVMTFSNMLWKLLSERTGGVSPTHIAVVFDASEKTFRNEIYADYKAHRPPAPEELIPQFPLIRDAVKAFNVACVELDGYEADDLIATYAQDVLAAGGDVTVVSSDKDLMQLVAPGIRMLDPMTNKPIGRDEVLEKFGVEPDKVIDVQALAGDSVDNVPGVPGIGIKTAAELIKEYGDLDSLLARAGEIKQPKRREKLIEFAEQARVSRELVRLKRDVPVTISADQFGVHDPVADTLIAFLRSMEFNTLTKRIAEALGVEAPPPLERASAAVQTSPPVSTGGSGDGQAAAPTARASSDGPGTPGAVVAFGAAAAKSVPVDRSTYETVTDLQRLESWIADCRSAGRFAFDTETTSLDAMRAELVGFSIAVAPGKACYVPLAHVGSNASGDLFATGGDKILPGQIPVREALARLKPLLEDPSILKIGQNLKYDCLVMVRHGIRIAPIDDTMLLSFALDGGQRTHGMDELSERHLQHRCITFSQVLEHAPGTKKAEKNFAGVPVAKATEYAAEDADITLRLWLKFKPRLPAERMTTVYETLERPLLPVLLDMERAGIKVDKAVLSRFSSSFAQSIVRLEEEIQQLAGMKFNLGSPRQLGELLFDKLKLPGGKKTKTGQWETRAGLLDDLAGNEELPEDVRRLINTMLEWRQLTKLRSTYTDALPEHVHPDTGRIHTSYSLAAAATGRLASTDPNLQNIPIRTKEGRQIRTAFIADDGAKLISADYSQIELRVLAHIADIQALRQAFEDGLDIHAMTASEMFGVPIKDMPGEVRRRAKAINFGIIYGISAFGLAAQLGISKQEAASYIDTYFKRFPGIRDYMDRTKKFARDNGFVQTIFGRKVHYPEINTKNPSMRGFLERAAINAPIQGSAADIIRRAMVRMPAALADSGLMSTTMLLQVHDELVFEAKEAEVAKAIPIIISVMEKAALPAIAMRVPIRVDAKSADNWEAAH